MRIAALTPTLPGLSFGNLLKMPGASGQAMRRRLRVLTAALTGPGRDGTLPAQDLRSLTERLSRADAHEVWLTIAVLTGSLPEVPDVIRGVRSCRMDGPSAFLDGLVSNGRLLRLLGGQSLPDVEVLTGAVLVDLEHTRRTELATGIQRVARMTTRRWARDHDVAVVGWTGDLRALRRLHPDEAARALTGDARGLEPVTGRQDAVVIPWRATYVLPELTLERERTHRLMAVARYSRSRTGIIGHDCVPVSSAETTDAWVSEGFTNYLAAVRHMAQVASVSEASAQEYRGWRRMLTAIGLEGPRVTAVPLPAETLEPTAQALSEARERMLVGSLPLVLCVGTHEPRKNHLAVLHAAEVLWRRGLRFTLTFIGGHSWNSQRFESETARLRAAGRPIQTLTSVTDDQLWAAYRVSHCVVFPSLNEGYGLPVAEALASGTPVVTSNFGSMAEIAAGGGAVLVDPRDDASLTEGLSQVLTDTTLYSRLCAEAAARPERTWDDYARETWDVLVDDKGMRP